MGFPLVRIETEALELSSTDRAQTATRLIASLNDRAPDDPAEVEAAWDAEIRRRLAELDVGGSGSGEVRNVH